MNADVEWLNLVLGFVLPVLVGLVTKQSWSGGLKASLLLALSGVAGVVGQVVDHGGFAGFDLKAAVIGALVTYVIGVATHFGLYTPSGVKDAAQRSLVRDQYDLAG